MTNPFNIPGFDQDLHIMKLYQSINKRHLNPSLAVLIFYFNIGIVRWMWILYSWHHRVGRVLSFFSVVGIGTPPTPHPPVVLFIYTYLVVGTVGMNIAGTGRMVALPDNHIRLLR
jgi:hypothetical protein